jgi:hypothetical protein
MRKNKREEQNISNYDEESITNAMKKKTTNS